MKVAYITADSCGSGHAVRGIALVQAGERAGIEVRAFGPPVLTARPLPDLTGYEASLQWKQAVLDWQPDLLLGDLRPGPLDPVRERLGVPAWLLLRIWPGEWRGAPGWRVIGIEPGVTGPVIETNEAGVSRVNPWILPVDASVPPIVGPLRYRPADGEEVQAGYNAFWEAAWYGYRDRVRWTDGGNPERAARIRAGGEVPENGADVLVRMALDRVLPAC